MDNNSEVVYLYLDDIIPNRFQPREVFDDQALKELAVSIKEHGVIQPIIVRKVENKYEIIAGERRYKASTMAGLTKIPAIVKNLDDKESSKVALIENLQRRDLSPIEEARTYQKILELEDNMTQEELAATMGKTQSSVSNKLRLLELPEEIQDALLKEKISERHARSLLTIEDKNDQIKMMDKVITEKMTVRELDKEIKDMKDSAETSSDSSIISSEANSSIESASTTVEGSETNAGSSLENIELPKPDLESFMSPGVSDEHTSVTDHFNSALSNIAPTTAPLQEENKFLPSMNSGNTNNSSNNFTGFFNPNVGEKQESSIVNSITSIASNIASGEISTPAPQDTLDINKAITDIKNTITSLQNDGYKITFEETDNIGDYKISIQVDKN